MLRKEGATAARVCELLSGDGQSWDDEALERNLIPMDAETAKVLFGYDGIQYIKRNS